MSDITTYNATALTKLKDKYVLAVKKDRTKFAENDTNYFLDLYFVDRMIKLAPFDFDNTWFLDKKDEGEKLDDHLRFFKVEDLDFVVK